MNHAVPYTPEELRGAVPLDHARVRATAMALQLAEERLGHPVASLGLDALLVTLQRQRDACARVAREYPASTTLGDQIARAVRATPLVSVPVTTRA